MVSVLPKRAEPVSAGQYGGGWFCWLQLTRYEVERPSWSKTAFAPAWNPVRFQAVTGRRANDHRQSGHRLRATAPRREQDARARLPEIDLLLSPAASRADARRGKGVHSFPSLRTADAALSRE